MKVFIAGDLFISHPLPKSFDPRVEKTNSANFKHDVRIANCETTTHDNEANPHLFLGGSTQWQERNVRDQSVKWGLIWSDWPITMLWTIQSLAYF